MANPTTLQMRQQEIHRPFQPLDTTEGQKGQPISEPQERYAGWWNPIEDISGRMASLYSRTGNKKKDDPELLRAQELWSTEAFNLQELLLNSTPEEIQQQTRDAAEVSQTREGYLRSLAIAKVRQQGINENIPERKMMEANQSHFKIDTQGAETVEERKYKQTRLVTDEMIKDGYGVQDSNGEIDMYATNKKAAEIIHANSLRNKTFDEGIGKELGFTMADYAVAKGFQKDQMTDDIANYAFSKVVNPLVSLELESLVKAINTGNITNVRDASLAFKNSLMSAVQQVNQSNDIPAGAKTRVLNDLQNISKYAEELEKQPDVQLKDLENALTRTTLLMKATALQDKGVVGLITRISNILPPELANTVIQSIKADPTQPLFGLATATKMFDSTMLASNLTTNELKQYANIGGNVANILEGKSPVYGTQEDQTKAQAIAFKYINQSVVNPEKVTPQQRMEMANITEYLLNTCDKALRKDPDVRGATGQAYANFVEYAAADNFKGVFIMNNAIKQKFLDLYEPVTDSYLIYPSGPAGVLRNTTPTDDRWIAYDDVSGSFVGGKAMLSGGTTGWSFNKTVDRINDAFKTKCFGFEVKNNKEPDSLEKKQIADDIIKLLVAANVDPKMFKSFEGNQKKK